jgi:hypothetical protein
MRFRTPVRWLTLAITAALAACAPSPEPQESASAAAAPPPTPPPAARADAPYVPEADGAVHADVDEVDVDEEGDYDDNEGDFDPAPWSAPKLAAADVPPMYLQEWRKADNRATCAPVAPVPGFAEADARPRRANFSGGWAVAYDQPGDRSAFGVAGAGVAADGDIYDGWPGTIAWNDGSGAGYGLEGGTGPSHLAFLTIAGQGCLYNVWSHRGEEHLLSLLRSLRFVETSAAP